MKKPYYTYLYIALIFFCAHLSFIDISLCAGELDGETVKSVLFGKDRVPCGKNEFDNFIQKECTGIFLSNFERHLFQQEKPKSWTMKYSHGEGEAFLPCNVLGLIEASDTKKTKAEKKKLLIEWLLVIKSVAKLERYKPLVGKFLLFYELNQLALKIYKAKKASSSFQDLLNIFSVSQINSDTYFSGFSQAIRRDIDTEEYDKMLTFALKDIHITMFEESKDWGCLPTEIMTASLSEDYYNVTIENIAKSKKQNSTDRINLIRKGESSVPYALRINNKSYGIELFPAWVDETKGSEHLKKNYHYFMNKNFFVVADKEINKKAIFPLFNIQEENIMNVFLVQYIIAIMHSKHNTDWKHFYCYPVKSAQQYVKDIINGMHKKGFLSSQQRYCYIMLAKNNILDISFCGELINSGLILAKIATAIFLPFSPLFFISGYSIGMIVTKIVSVVFLAGIVILYNLPIYYASHDSMHCDYADIIQADIEVTKKQ